MIEMWNRCGYMPRKKHSPAIITTTQQMISCQHSKRLQPDVVVTSQPITAAADKPGEHASEWWLDPFTLKGKSQMFWGVTVFFGQYESVWETDWSKDWGLKYAHTHTCTHTKYYPKYIILYFILVTVWVFSRDNVGCKNFVWKNKTMRVQKIFNE